MTIWHKQKPMRKLMHMFVRMFMHMFVRRLNAQFMGMLNAHICAHVYIYA